MFAKSVPALLETVEDSGKVAQQIEKGCLNSGRVKASDEDFGKGMSFIIQIGAPESADPAQAQLHGGHGEEFHSDADRTVVEYLTTIEKIDLKNSPVHNPYVTPSPTLGFPIARSERVGSALDAITKGFAPAPKKPRMGLKKPPKDPLQAKQEAQQREEAGLGKSANCGMSPRASAMKVPGAKKKERTAKSLNREDLMAKAFGWSEGFWV